MAGQGKLLNLDADGREDWIKWRTDDVDAEGKPIKPQRKDGKGPRESASGERHAGNQP